MRSVTEQLSETGVPGLPADPGVPLTTAVFVRLAVGGFVAVTFARKFTLVDAPGPSGPICAHETVLPATVQRPSRLTTLAKPAGSASLNETVPRLASPQFLTVTRNVTVWSVSTGMFEP